GVAAPASSTARTIGPLAPGPTPRRRCASAVGAAGEVRRDAGRAATTETTSEVNDGIVRNGRAPGAGRYRSTPLVGARASLRRLLHGGSRRHDPGRGASLDRSRPLLREAGSAMGAERLCPHLRRPALARGARGRPARTPSRVHGRCPVLHGRVAHVRARLVAGGA